MVSRFCQFIQFLLGQLIDGFLPMKEVNGPSVEDFKLINSILHHIYASFLLIHVFTKNFIITRLRNSIKQFTLNVLVKQKQKRI